MRDSLIIVHWRFSPFRSSNNSNKFYQSSFVCDDIHILVHVSVRVSTFKSTLFNFNNFLVGNYQLRCSAVAFLHMSVLTSTACRLVLFWHCL